MRKYEKRRVLWKWKRESIVAVLQATVRKNWAFRKKSVRRWIEEKIDEAIRDGFTNFITGCAQGVDLWAGEIVLRKKENNPDLHLIAAIPWPGFGKSWGDPWRDMYDNLLHEADLVVNVCDHYYRGVFQQRNIWMVDHSHRVIAVYNGTAGGTRNTIVYAEKMGIEVVRE